MIDEIKLLQRQRRTLAENIEDAEATLESAQQQMRDLAQMFSDPEHTGELSQLTDARERVKTAGAAVAAARGELDRFDAEHEDLDVRLAREAVAETARQQRETQTEFAQSLKAIITALDTAWAAEQTLRPQFETAKSKWPLDRPGKEPTFAAGLKEDLLRPSGNGLFEIINTYTGQISPGTYFEWRAKAEGWLKESAPESVEADKVKQDQ